MKTNRIIWTLLAAAACLCPAAGAAEGNRFLLVFETTKAMKRDLEAARLSAKDLLMSDFNSQGRTGDTLGVWTYDSELHTGLFPMQELSTDDETELAKHLDDFLKQQRCNGNARFDQVLAGLNRVVAESETLTVLIFSDGYDPITGTPFDASVNDVYAQHRAELRDAHIPFVTLLQARDGKIVRGTVNSAVGPIEIPSLPAPPAPPKAAVEEPAPAPAPAPEPAGKTNPPLILDYSQAAMRAKAAAQAAAQVAQAAQAAKKNAGTGSSEAAAKSNDASAVPGVLAATLSTITNIMNLAPASPVATSPAAAPVVVPVATGMPVVASQTTPESAPTAGEAATAAPEKGAGRGGFILAGLGLVLALGGLALLGLWRMRSAPRASVITESFNRPKK